MKSKFFLLLAGFALMVATAGCIFSPDDDERDIPPPPPPVLPFPGSPDVLMANFQTIYETMDFDEYRKIMHPDFLTILQEETIIDFRMSEPPST